MTAPVPDADETAAAVAVVNAIADDLEAGVGRTEGPAYSLAFGDAGVALLFGALAREGCRRGAGVRAEDFLRVATRQVAETRPGSSLYVGWPGVAFASAIVREPDEARRTLANATAALRRGVSTTPWRGRLDLTDGLAGLGALALALLPAADAAAAAAAVVHRLDELARPMRDGVAWVDPTQPEVISVGLAHGVAGIVSLLAASHEAGIEQAVAGRLIDGAVAWLLSLAPVDDRRFPPHAAVPAHAAPALPRGWCWGDAGVALAIARAARVRGRDDWRDVAVNVALAEVQQDPGAIGLTDACFCHGSSGVAHVLRALLDLTGDHRLADPIRSWTRRVLAARVPGEGVGGFRAAAYLWRPDTDWIADRGLQRGAAGVGLALLAACGLGGIGWDHAFLIPSFG